MRWFGRPEWILVLTLSAGGCRLLASYDGAPDGGPLVVDARAAEAMRLDRGIDGCSDGCDVGADDVRLPDTRNDVEPKDVGLPDVTPPDVGLPADAGPPGGFFEDYLTGLGNVDQQSGSWTVSGGSLHQDAIDYNGYFVSYDLPIKDYVAETRVTISAIKGVVSWSEGAGLAVRVQPGAQLPNPPGQYSCVVSPDSQILGLGHCPGGANNNCLLMMSKPAAIFLNTAVVVRVTAQGNAITCELPELGVSFTYVNSSYPNGGVSLITFYGKSAFEYLRVTPL